MSPCPTPDCKNIFYLEKDQNDYKCPLCNKQYIFEEGKDGGKLVEKNENYDNECIICVTEIDSDKFINTN